MENPIRRSAAPVSDPDLVALEAKIGLCLPADYWAFLLAHNGGVPRRNRFSHVNTQGQTRETWLRWIYSVGREGLLDGGAGSVAGALVPAGGGWPWALVESGLRFSLTYLPVRLLEWRGIYLRL